MHYAPGDITAHCDSVLKRLDGQAELHPRVDRVPDDPVRVPVLHGAEVDLVFTRVVLGDVCEPGLVRLLRGELALHEVVVDRWPGALVLSTARLTEDRPPSVRPAESPRVSFLSVSLSSDCWLG